MKTNITIDPITRISGFLEISTDVENNIITNAKTCGLLFRGFEKMLAGRSPLDAIYFTERICGICSTSHAIASSLALKNAFNEQTTLNDLYLRDLAHGFEFLQNHLRQFFLFTVPDYVKLPEINPLVPQQYTDYRLNEADTQKILNSYNKNIYYSRLCHEGLAVLGGKAPHNHGIFISGVTVNIDSYKIEKIKSIIYKLKNFINSNLMEAMNIIAYNYPDYFEAGISYSNYMSYGLFSDYKNADISYVPPGVMLNRIRYPLELNNITENITASWYTGTQNLEKPNDINVFEVDLKKPDSYSFIKAPRYKGLPMEGGPLARLMLAGEYLNGNSCMDRNFARVLETKKIINIMSNMANLIKINPNNQKIYTIPNNCSGIGITDTIRGALGHWVHIENKVIKNYNIITPTGWNLSPIDEKGIHGPAEYALIGTVINNKEDNIKLGRIVRSFDPCVSCATH